MCVGKVPQAPGSETGCPYHYMEAQELRQLLARMAPTAAGDDLDEVVYTAAVDKNAGAACALFFRASQGKSFPGFPQAARFYFHEASQ